jgi:hypothetical protein
VCGQTTRSARALREGAPKDGKETGN